jgi:hypothetical protein
MAAWERLDGPVRPLSKKRLSELIVQAPIEPLAVVFPDVLKACVLSVNECQGAERLFAILALASAARLPTARAQVMDALDGLDVGIEALLRERELARGSEVGAWKRDLHEAVVLLLVRLSGYDLSAADLLEMVDNDVQLTAELLTRLVVVRTYEVSIALCACRMLFELTLPSATVAGSSATTEFNLDLVVKHSESVASLLLSPQGQPVLEAASLSMASRVQTLARSSASWSADSSAALVAVTTYCRFLINAWSFASGSTGEALRGHLAVATSIAPALLAPTIHVCVEWALSGAGGAEVASTTLAACLQLLALVAYHREGAMRETLGKMLPALRRAFGESSVLLHARLVALLLIALINMGAVSLDTVRRKTEPEASAKLQSEATQLLVESVASGQLGPQCDAVGAVLTASTAWLPVSKESDSFAATLLLLTLPRSTTPAPSSLGEAALEPPPPTEAALEPPPPAPPTEAALEPANTTLGSLRQSPIKEPEPPSTVESLPPLLGVLPPVRPSKASAAWDDPELDMAVAPMHRRREWAERKWKAAQEERALREGKKSLSAAPKSTVKPVPAVAPPRGDIPASFVCALDGNAMRDPVRRGGEGGHGPTFERAAILSWLARFGHVCPVTGEPLAPSDLRPVPSLQAQLQEWRASKLSGPVTAPQPVGTSARAAPVLVADTHSLVGDGLYEF